MEWRIIVPVLCLIGILHVPGNAAQTKSPTILYRFTLHFSINDTFLSDYSNITNNATSHLIKNITSQVEPLYKLKYPNFQRFDISKFSNGSIVTEGELQFSNDSKPNASDLAQVLNNGSFSFALIMNSTKTAEVTETAVAKISLVFKLLQTFKANYSNLNDPETKELTNNITTACSRVYKSRFPQFYRMLIKSFSNGSIVTDSVLEFNTANSASPDVTEVKNTLIAAITNGNFSFKVDNTSIISAVIPEIDSSLKDYNITFKMNQTFTNDLSNMSSDGATKLAKNVTSELDGLYKNFKDFNRTLVWRFRNGSIVVDGLLGFNRSSNALPSVSVLARTLAEAVRNGTVKLPIDPKSINVTDPATGVSANRSPVLASMLTAVWMTLASLLLSAVIH
ncbi:hypothetical protein DPX16_21626 [Anabarilius grahami]|uniref:SEA domain-containing protein n=1 Tax=Anabarilius grahami TaxID=495550 RepID=A0A3N0YJL8_ANAGA|nr:hypothetical protein DPX16_21626 [Anabarilius grahami]